MTKNTNVLDALCDAEGRLDVLIDDAICEDDEATIARLRTHRDAVRSLMTFFTDDAR